MYAINTDDQLKIELPLTTSGSDIFKVKNCDSYLIVYDLWIAILISVHYAFILVLQLPTFKYFYAEQQLSNVNSLTDKNNSKIYAPRTHVHELQIMEIVLKIIKGFAGLRLYLISISCRTKLVRDP